MIVEFFGVPGSGKTTLASAVTAKLANDGLAVAMWPCADPAWFPRLRRRPDKLLHLARLTVTRPQLIRYARDVVVSAGVSGIGEQARLTQALAYLLSLREFEERRHDVLILHQGFLQLAYSIAFVVRAHGIARVDELVARLPPATLSVLTSVSAEVVAERLARRRGTGSRLEVEVRTDRQAIRTSESIVERIAASRLAGASAPLLRSPSDETVPLDVRAREVAQVITELLQCRESGDHRSSDDGAAHRV